jgi:nucleoside-diphosphate-sugar epimerase
MKTVLLTGSQGFIGSYISQELLSHNYRVIGIDNYSKYGRVKRKHDNHKNFSLIEHDLSKSFPDVNGDILIAGAAMIGGISYFHKYAYDLLATNERITANTFDYAIKKTMKVIAISSSMVFENATEWPTKEEHKCFPPYSTYGFQKLSLEYFCKGAYEQYGLDYTIVRPFNCVGTGEEPSGEIESVGNISMVLSHVVPDLIIRSLSLSKNDRLPILGDGNQIRHYTNGKDIATGIRLAMEKGRRTDYNISSKDATSVIALASMIWNKIHGNEPAFDHNAPFNYDVQLRSPDVTKAYDELGFEAKISLDESIDEVIQYIKEKQNELVNHNTIYKNK